jgi:hypothetical protein
MNKEIRKVIAAWVIAILWGGALVSCTLEQSVDSPGNRQASLIKGAPAGLTVYEPQITYDGDTLILTYTVRADFSKWAEGGLGYTAQADTAEAANAAPQSVEALLWHYGAKDDASWLFAEKITSTAAETAYYLNNNNLPRFVILQLDTALIKEWLRKRIGVIKESEDKAPSLVWIEDSPGIPLIERSQGTWEKGTYEGTYEEGKGGIRISGLYYTAAEESSEGNGVEIACDIDKFDEGGDKRPKSIATVLVGNTEKDKYISTVNFYAGDTAEAIPGGITETFKDAGSTKEWVKKNPPLLRVVYLWAE